MGAPLTTWRWSALPRVSDVLLNPEHSVAAAKMALEVVQKEEVDTNAEHALTALIPELESTLEAPAGCSPGAANCVSSKSVARTARCSSKRLADRNHQIIEGGRTYSPFD